MVTAMDSVDARVEGLDIGADDYIVKPFALKELLARINAHIRRKHDNLENGTNLYALDLILDTKTKIVTRAGKEIKLSRKLYQLLELLIRNK
jgi:two-component system response regulator MprA